MPSKELKNILLLLIIILAGLLLRYAGLYWAEGYRYFAIGDEINAYRVAHDYLAGNEQAQYLGQPDFAGGRVPGPLWALCWVLPMKWGASPEGIILLMILLNTAVIPLIYILSRKLLGDHALWAPLFYALSPWPVYYAVGAWNPLPMAFLGVLLYLSLWAVTRRPDSGHIFWVCVVMAVMPHFHMIAVFVAPAVLLILFLSPARISRKWLVLGLIAGIGVYIPYLWGESIHHWSNTRAMMGGGWKFSFSVLRVLATPVDVLSNVVSRWTGYSFADYRDFGNFFLGSFYVLAAFNVVAVALSILYLGRFLIDFLLAFRNRWRYPSEAFRFAPAISFIGILLLLPPLLFVLTGHGYNSRYAIVQFPLLFLLPPLFIRELKDRGSRRIWIGGIAALLVFNVALTVTFFVYQGQRIKKAEYFTASFRKMATIHGILKADAGSNRPIRIDAKTYLDGKDEEVARGVIALRDFIDIEEQFDKRVNRRLAEKVYEVRAAQKKEADNEKIVYKANNIMLVADGTS